MCVVRSSKLKARAQSDEGPMLERLLPRCVAAADRAQAGKLDEARTAAGRKSRGAKDRRCRMPSRSSVLGIQEASGEWFNAKFSKHVLRQICQCFRCRRKGRSVLERDGGELDKVGKHGPLAWSSGRTEWRPDHFSVQAEERVRQGTSVASRHRP